MSDPIHIHIAPETVPTTPAPIHESATHIDALGMPVAGVGKHPFHPTPCCGAAMTYHEIYPCCKACWHDVDPAYGNVPVEPFTPRGNA